jgi:hypothetical protein
MGLEVAVPNRKVQLEPTAGAPLVAPPVADPALDAEGVAAALRATGLTELEAQVNLFHSGDPVCRAHAVAWAQGLLEQADRMDRVLGNRQTRSAVLTKFQDYPELSLAALGGNAGALFDHLLHMKLFGWTTALRMVRTARQGRSLADVPEAVAFSHECLMEARRELPPYSERPTAFEDTLDALLREDVDLGNAVFSAMAGLTLKGPLDFGRHVELAALPQPLRAAWLARSGVTQVDPGQWVAPSELLDACGADLDLPKQFGVTSIRALPRNFQVQGDLRLDCPRLQELPEGLVVEGTLGLTGTGIQFLPADLKVEGSLELTDVPIRTLPAGMTLTGLGLMGTFIAELPEGMTLRELALEEVPLRHLPMGLTVTGNLHLRDCAAWDGVIPADTKVGGTIFTDLHSDGIGLKDWRKRYGAESCHRGLFAKTVAR